MFRNKSWNAENSIMLDFIPTTSDLSPLQSITCHKINGQNYLQWSQSVMMFICGKGKKDLIAGASKRPATIDGSKSWNAENSMLMSWLVNSMVPDIRWNFSYILLPKKYGRQSGIRILPMTILLNYSAWKAAFMTSARVRTWSQLTSIPSPNSGSSWICSNHMTGNVPWMKQNSKRLWRPNEYSSSFSDLSISR